MRTLLPVLALWSACNGSVTVTDDEPGDLTWYTTCGDPVCQSYRGPFDGVDACTDEVEGQACTTAEETCDPMSECNALLVCATSDPKDQVGGCPISLRRYKHDIRYLGTDDLDRLRELARGVRLATWRYNGSDPAAQPRLGFVIDDDPTSPAVAPDGEHVDVYGLASLALAALQAQERELADLRARQAALEARLAALEAP